MTHDQTTDDLLAALTDAERERLAAEYGSLRWTKLPLATLQEAIVRLRRPPGRSRLTREEFWRD